jgi:hypothetical protein
VIELAPQGLDLALPLTQRLGDHPDYKVNDALGGCSITRHPQ